MLMKIKLTIALLTLFTVVFMAGCDKIDPPYINESGGGGGGGEGEVVQKVLLEDYTGHTCVNCPAAAKIASDLQKFYGEKLIVMAVHTGFFADPMQPPFDTDFRTEVGDKWRTDFGFVSYPSGMINRGAEGGRIAGKGQWASRVDAAMQETAKASLKIEINYAEANRQLALKIDSRFLQNASEKYLLQVCLVEDSIMAPQRNNDPTVGETPTITEYYHRHVLRKDLNGVNGETISSTSIVANETYIHEYNFTLNTDYNADRCSIIAFIYREADLEIVQVEEAHIK